MAGGDDSTVYPAVGLKERNGGRAVIVLLVTRNALGCLPKDREGGERRIELMSVISFDFRHVISLFFHARHARTRTSERRPAFFGAKSNFVLPSCISAKRKNNNNIGPRLKKSMSSQALDDVTYITRISNPGIAERLEKDVSCFNKSYGFEFRRGGGDNGIFVSRNISSVRPIACIRIQVQDSSLVSSIGPFLRTLVRLCVEPIDPRSLLATVIISNCHKKKKSDDVVRSIAHEIHMLIRNSMMTALFVNLHIILPPDTRRDSVLEKMKENENGCYEYPSVTLHEYSSSSSSSSLCDQMGNRKPFHIELGLMKESSNAPPIVTKPIPRDCLVKEQNDGNDDDNACFDLSTHYISIFVTTRMCTIRLTPIIYHLSQGLSPRVFVSRSNNTNTTTPPTATTNNPMIVVCLEKVSNLYRVLMLARDYGGISCIGQNLVIICHNDVVVETFDKAAKEFVSKNFLKREERRQKQQQQDGIDFNTSCCYHPKVVSIENAKTIFESLSNIVGIDLHENAVTLDGINTNSEAMTILGSAGAIIFGFESDGIPGQFNKSISQYVQVQSRTSINVVAAVAIFLHALRQ